MIYDDFVKWLDNLDLSTVDANPITFNLTDFESDMDFANSMVLAGRHLVDEEDIVDSIKTLISKFIRNQ